MDTIIHLFDYSFNLQSPFQLPVISCFAYTCQNNLNYFMLRDIKEGICLDQIFEKLLFNAFLLYQFIDVNL